jgi:hypothetical protein
VRRIAALSGIADDDAYLRSTREGDQKVLHDGGLEWIGAAWVCRFGFVDLEGGGSLRDGAWRGELSLLRICATAEASRCTTGLTFVKWKNRCSSRLRPRLWLLRLQECG